jgi:tRNA-2-methylthio-N6-dimethylallyladenosine synthase
LRGQIAETVKSERLQILQELLEGQQRRFNDSCTGRVLPVLFEKPGRHPGQLVGRSPYLQWVHAQAPARCQGAVLPVRITGALPNSLAGEVETLAEVVG